MEQPPPVPTGELFRPRSRPQQMFADSTADIAIIGGSVHGGKTWSLTYDPTKHVHVPGFTCVAFRRTAPEMRNPGGMWDETTSMYPFFGGTPRSHHLEWDFPAPRTRIKLAGIQHDTDVLGWKSSQICLLEFDQLEEFSAHQFWYMLSRNRSSCGIRPYVRASANPDPDSFLADFLSWWIDQDSGYAIPERSGKVRWFVRVGDELMWGDSQEELLVRFPDHGHHARTVTFILSRLQDNIIGNEKDPSYLSNVMALPLVERERLLGGDKGGNWKIRAAAGLVFNRAWFGDPRTWLDAPPADARWVRGWDNAGTVGAGDFTAGVKLGFKAGTYFVGDVVRGQWAGDDRETRKRQAAEADGVATRIRLEQEPGSAGVDQARDSIRRLAGYTVHAKTSTGGLLVRSGPFATQVQAGNVKLIRGPWNEAFLRELDAFPTKGVPDDQVSAVLGAFEELVSWPSYNPDDFITFRR